MPKISCLLFVLHVLFATTVAASESSSLTAKTASVAEKEPEAQLGPTSSEQLARELIEVTGMMKYVPQLRAQMLADLRQKYPDMRAEFWQTFEDRIDPDDMIDLAVPVYARHLSDEEMRAALAFHRSPQGQSIIAKMPALLQELAVVGQEWSTGIATEAQRRIQEAQPDSQ